MNPMQIFPTTPSLRVRHAAPILALALVALAGCSTDESGAAGSVNASAASGAVAKPAANANTVTRTGQLDASDPVMDEDSTYFDAWTLEGQAGERLTVSEKSKDFDSYLFVSHIVGEKSNVIKQDDDSGGGSDARLEVTLPSAGTYAILTNVRRKGATGRYELVVESSMPGLDGRLKKAE